MDVKVSEGFRDSIEFLTNSTPEIHNGLVCTVL